MREYLCYVLLVFIPIGFLMVKILKNYGLPQKNITYIVLISLIIIISFPVCMARFGIIPTFSLYAIFLLLVIYYIANIDEIVFNESNKSTIPSNFKSNKQNLDSNKQFESAIIKNQQELKSESLINNNRQDVNEIEDEIPLTNNTKEYIEETIELISEEFVKKPVEEIVYNTIGKKLEEPKEEHITENIVELTEELKIVKEAKEDGTEKIEETSIGEFIDELIDNSIIKEHTSELAIREPIGDMLNNETIITDELDKNNKLIKEKVTEKDRLDNIINIENKFEKDIIFYIEKGFQYKIKEDFSQALAEFLVVWEYTKDFDLKYLVTLELSELYMLEGLYSKAQELLTKFQTEIPSTKINEALEIKKRFDYITLINNEIERLGLEVVPLAKLPRLIKMKVAEELNQVD